MQRNREEIARRQIELDNCHEAVMEGTREVLKRAEEAAPLVYSSPVYTPAVIKANEPSGDVIPDAWIDAVAIALARTRDEFQATVEQAQTPLRENIARLEGQVATLMALLGEKNKRRK